MFAFQVQNLKSRDLKDYMGYVYKQCKRCLFKGAYVIVLIQLQCRDIKLLRNGMKNKKKHHTDEIVPQKSNRKSLHRGKIETPDTSKKHMQNLI